MLTKSDLKAIKTIVKTETDPLREDVRVIKKQIKPIKSMQKNIKILLRDVEYMSKTHDEGIVYLGRRVKKIEQHLKLPTIENPPAQN